MSASVWGPDPAGAYFQPTPDPAVSFRSPAARFTLPLTDDFAAEMPGQKRKRLTPGLSGFTKVGASDGLNPAGVDPLSMSYSGANAGFSCETPTMAPAAAPGPAGAKLYRFSPRLSASSGLFNSPMFSVQTPVFECQSAPNVFHGLLAPAPLGGGGATPPPPNGLMSPIPFMESPAAMYSHDLQQHSLAMDHPPGLSLAGTQPQSSVLERFKRFFDNQRAPADFGSPSTQPSAVGDQLSLGLPFQPPPDAIPGAGQSVPAPGDDADDVSSGDSHDALSPGAPPELAEQLLRAGSSCHQCKSRRMQGYLSFCSGAKSKRKSCRKKYCDACLAKFYQMAPSRHRSARDQATWSCPSCQGICCCAACRRSKVQHAQASRLHMQLQFARTPELYSPATSMAVGLVYFGDFDLLDGSGPVQLPPPAVPSVSPRPSLEPLSFAPLP